MKISIIIPVFNAAKFLTKCLNSVLSQTLKDIEVVCVNDGSTDNSCEIIRNVMARDKRVVLYHQVNSGSGKARNLALSKARGEYVAFMDSDDWYPTSNVLEMLYVSAKKNQVLICGGSFVRYYSDGRVEQEFFNEYKAYKFEIEGKLSFSEYQFDYGYHRFIYSREQLIEAHRIEFPDYRRYQDPVFFAKAMALAGEFYAIPDQVYAYRKGHQTISWDEVKVSGLICGISDNLFISRMKKYPKLHMLNINRVINDFRSIIQGEIDKSLLVQYHLTRLIGNVDCSLIRSSYPEWSEDNYNDLLRENSMS